MDGFATLVTRCGKLFEDLSKEKNKSNPLFLFLSGGNGHEYYARKLWETKQKSVRQRQEVRTPSDRKMTAESRGKILGEKPLNRSTKDSTTSVAHKEVVLQSNLTDTFAKPKSAVDFSERAKPFGDDPAKHDRFEQFLKDKYQGGLRSIYAGSLSSMSKNDRARERLDFEAAAESIEKGEWNTKTSIPSSLHVIDLLGRDDRFISSSAVEKHQSLKVEEKVDKLYPKREEFQWHPSPILCKRFDLIDPFMGKVYVLHPKQDLHGLGHDPFKHSPEFRDRKRLRDSRCNDKGSKNDISTRSKLSENMLLALELVPSRNLILKMRIYMHLVCVVYMHLVSVDIITLLHYPSTLLHYGWIFTVRYYWCYKRLIMLTDAYCIKDGR